MHAPEPTAQKETPCLLPHGINKKQVLAKHLAPPGRLADLLAIAGDKADGIRGADGYGPVNAAKV